MSESVGPVKKLSFGSTNIILTNDNEVNFWPGGWVNTGSENDVGGQVPVTEFIGGMLTGITSRCAKSGSVQALADLVKKTTVGDVDIVVELNNGDKFSASCYAVVDPSAFFSNRDGKAKMDIYPRKGEFSPI